MLPRPGFRSWLFGAPGSAYRAVDTDEEDSAAGAGAGGVGATTLASGFASMLRARFGSMASTVLFLSTGSVLFAFAVLGEQFTSVVLPVGVAGTPATAAAATATNSSASLSTPTSPSALLLVANATSSAASPSPPTRTTSLLHSKVDPKSTIFYWTLALGTLFVLLAIFRSLLLLRRTLVERSSRGGGTAGFAFGRGVGIRRGLSLTDLINGNLGNLRSHLSLMGRELNENDFDALTQLDAINQLQDSIGRGRSAGASEQMINRLPLHTMTSAEIASKVGSNAQTCTVCMEPFEEGALVRTALCLHCFHKDCIDPWLRLHANCPICKSSILEDERGEWVNDPTDE